MARAGESPEVVLEATYGWYWAADALAELGATVHLAHPFGVKAFSYRRVKNDQRDAADLADLLRMGRLPRGVDRAAGDPGAAGAGAAPGQAGRDAHPSCKAQVHAVLAKGGIWVPMTDLFGVAGNRLLDQRHAARHRTRRGSRRCAGSSTRSTSRSTCSPVWRSVG